MALTAWKLAYLSACIALPSIGVTLLVIMSSFLDTALHSGNILWLILLLSMLFQIIFLVILYRFMRKQKIDAEFRKRQIIFFLCVVLVLAPLIFAFSVTLIDILNHCQETSI